MTHRVIQWATGNTGMLSLSQVIEHPDMELVGLWVHGEAKEGLDAGDLCGQPTTGVIATRDVQQILDTPADCVIFMGADPEFSDATEHGSHGSTLVDQICALLESGKNVVSTSLTAMVWPQPHWAPVVERLTKAAQTGGTSVHFTGTHPGVLFDRMPLLVSALTPRVESVRFRCMLSNWALYNDMPTLRARGFGLTPAEFEAFGLTQIDEGNDWVREMRMAHHAIISELGGVVESSRGQLDYLVTPVDIEIAAGTIPAGTVGAIHFTLDTDSGGRTRVYAEQAVALDDALLKNYGTWDDPATPGGVEFTIEGDVPISLRLGFGTHDRPFLIDALVATAAMAVNAVHVTCAAAPGLYTAATLPPAMARLVD